MDWQKFLESLIVWLVIGVILIVLYNVLDHAVKHRTIIEEKCKSYENNSMLFSYGYSEKCHYISNDSNLWECSRKIVEINDEILIGKLICEED